MLEKSHVLIEKVKRMKRFLSFKVQLNITKAEIKN